MRRGSKPGWVRQLAAGRIEKLLRLAEQNAKTKPERAKRYVRLARSLSSKYKTMISSVWKKRFCKCCGVFWTAANRKVRANPRTKCVEYVCLECGAKKRYVYGKCKTRYRKAYLKVDA